MKPCRAVAIALVLAAAVGARAQGPPPIRLGHYGSMSGPKAAFGDSTDKGIRLAVAQANASGGVLGRTVAVVTEDDQSNPDQVLPSVIRLIDRHRVDVVLGEVSSTLTLIGAPYCQERRVPMITPSSVARAITAGRPYVFRACFTDDYQGRAAAILAYRDLGARRVALLVDRGNDYSTGYAAAFRDLFARLGGTVIADLTYKEGDKDFKSQLTRFAEARPDAVVLPAMYTDVPGVARQARGLGLTVPLLGGDGWDASETAEIGGRAVEGDLFMTHYAPDAPGAAVRTFLAAYRDAYGPKPPDGMAALAYDAAGIVLDAIRQAGTTDKAAVRDALAATRGYPGVTGTISMGPGRDPIKSVMAVQIRGGAFHLYRAIQPDEIERATGSGPASSARARFALPSTRFVLQQVANGLSLGAIYALIAVGYTIVYGILRLINFAHGDVFMLGPVFVIALAPVLGPVAAHAGGVASGLAAFAAAMALCAAVGFALERVAYRPLRRPSGRGTIATMMLLLPAALAVLAAALPADRPEARQFCRVGAIGAFLYGTALALNRVAARLGIRPTGRLVPLITAIGASLFLEYLTQQRALFGNRPRGFPAGLVAGLLGGGGSGPAPLRWGGLVVDRVDVLVLVATLLLVVLLGLVVRRTRLGLAMRAVSGNPDAAVLMGVDTDLVIGFSFVLGGSLAGAAGILWAMKYPAVDPLMGLLPGLKAFVAAVLGGIGSLPGAVLGGLIMGVSEAFLAASPASEYKDALAFLLLIAVLLVRPAGLLGRNIPEKV